jgi:hypothetical protein
MFADDTIMDESLKYPKKVSNCTKMLRTERVTSLSSFRSKSPWFICLQLPRLIGCRIRLVSVSHSVSWNGAMVVVVVAMAMVVCSWQEMFAACLKAFHGREWESRERHNHDILWPCRKLSPLPAAYNCRASLCNIIFSLCSPRTTSRYKFALSHLLDPFTFNYSVLLGCPNHGEWDVWFTHYTWIRWEIDTDI